MLALAPDEDLPWSVAVRPRGGEQSSMVAGDQTGTGESRHSREQQSRSTHWCRNQVTPLTVALIYS